MKMRTVPLLWALCVEPHRSFNGLDQWHDFWAWYPVRTGRRSWGWLSWQRRKFNAEMGIMWIETDEGLQRSPCLDGLDANCLLLPALAAIFWAFWSGLISAVFLIVVLAANDLFLGIRLGGTEIMRTLFLLIVLGPLFLVAPIVTVIHGYCWITGQWMNRHMWWPK